MKKNTFIFLFLLTGKWFSQCFFVYDNSNNQLIPFAQISVYDTNNKLLYQKSTDENGYLCLQQKIQHPNSVILKVFAFKYQIFQKHITLFDTSQIKIYLMPITHALDEIVVTGEAIPTEQQNSVYVIKSISEQKIQSMGAQNLRDVLLNENNVQLNNDPVLGTGINLLGLSGQSVKILIDGVPVIGRLNGNIDLSQINLNNVEKIEIIEGPMAVKYGTDAMGGVINIITKKSAAKNFSNKLYAYYESNGTYNLNNTLLFSIKQHTLNFSAGRNFFDGWKPGESPFHIEQVRIADTLRYKLWKPKEQYYASASDEFKLKKLNVNLYADGFYEIITDRGKPFPPYFESAIDNVYKTIRNTQRVNITGYLKKDYYLNFMAARTDYLRIKNAYYNDLTTLEKRLTTNEGDQDTSRYTMYMSRASVAKKIIDNHTVELGYDAYHEAAQSSIIKNKHAQQTDIAGFFSYSFNIKNKLSIKPAIRYSYNSLYNTPVIPSIHFLYNLKSNNKDSTSSVKSSIRFSYARGFRTPSLKELFLNFVDINHNIIGNPDLKPELSNYYNIHYTSNFYSKKITLQTDFNAFYNDIQNVITLGMINAVQYSYLNVDKIQTAGFSAGSSLSWKDALTISPKISFLGKKFYLNQQNTFYFYPEIILNASYLHKKWKAGLNIFSKYTGKMPYVKTNNDNYATIQYMKDYYWLDMNIYKYFWKDKVQITIGVKNLFNLTVLNAATSGGAHSSAQTLLGTGRNYFIQFNLNL